MSVLALAEAKTHLNLTGNTSDVELQSIIESAESAISRRVGPLAQIAVTERIRGRRRALVVSKLPAAELTSVTDAAGNALNVADLELAEDGVLEHANGVGVFSGTVYVVAYVAGWAVLDPEAEGEARWPGPADLLLGIKELTRHFWSTQRAGGETGTRKPGSQPSSTVSNTVPGAAYALPIRVEQLITPYAHLAS